MGHRSRFLVALASLIAYSGLYAAEGWYMVTLGNLISLSLRIVSLCTCLDMGLQSSGVGWSAAGRFTGPRSGSCLPHAPWQVLCSFSLTLHLHLVSYLKMLHFL